jgi:hypothetical protein
MIGPTFANEDPRTQCKTLTGGYNRLQCCAAIGGDRYSFGFHQCRRAPEGGSAPGAQLFCKQHNPANVAARRRESQAHYEAKIARSPGVRLAEAERLLAEASKVLEEWLRSTYCRKQHPKKYVHTEAVFRKIDAHLLR